MGCGVHCLVVAEASRITCTSDAGIPIHTVVSSFGREVTSMRGEMCHGIETPSMRMSRLMSSTTMRFGSTFADAGISIDISHTPSHSAPCSWMVRGWRWCRRSRIVPLRIRLTRWCRSSRMGVRRGVVRSRAGPVGGCCVVSYSAYACGDAGGGYEDDTVAACTGVGGHVHGPSVRTPLRVVQ